MQNKCIKVVIFFVILHIQKSQYLFNKDEILKFNKQTIINNKEAYKKIQVFDIRVFQYNKIRDYKIQYFYQFIEQREPEQKLIYFKDKLQDQWQKMPQECTLPLFDENYFSENVSSFCDMQYINGKKTASDLAQYFFSDHDLVELNDEKEFEIILENLRYMFNNKTEIVQQQIVDDINSRTAQEYRNKMYCHLQSVDYDKHDYEDVCYKKGFVLEMRNWLEKYAIKTKSIFKKYQIDLKKF